MEIKKLFKIVLLLLVLLPLQAFAANSTNNTIEILKPTIYPDTSANQKLVKDLIEGASILTTRIYSDYLKISNSSSQSGRSADYSLAINYVYDPGGSVLQLSLKNKKTNDDTAFNIMGNIKKDSSLFMARAIFYLWAGQNKYLIDYTSLPPVYVDNLNTNYIQQTVLPEMPATLMPMDLAVKPNGNLLGAFSMICVEFDSKFRILGQPGRSLYEAGSYTSAAGVAITPGGTVYLKPSMGRDIYRFSTNSVSGEKWRTGMDLYGPYTALSDGSIVLIDIQKKKALKIYNRKRTELPLFTSSYSYIAAITTGPEGNIWVYDLAEQRIRIHTPEGEILDSIIPVIDTSSGMSPSSLSVYKDGSFVIFYSTGELHRFTRKGIPVWAISEFISPEGSESFPQTAKTAVDSTNGLIYIADLMGQRIIKLQDTAYVTENRIDDSTTESLIGLNNKYIQSKNIKFIDSKADFYEKLGALELATQTWEGIINIDPNYEPAYEKLDQVKVKIMSLNAEAIKDKTISELEIFGPETARNDYRRTIQLYEKILAIDPTDIEIITNKKNLEEIFGMGKLEKKEPAPIEIEVINVENLFPSLMQYYQNYPVGNITIKNTGNKDIRDLKVSLYIKQFMDFPVFSRETAVLNPGKSANIDLKLLFNQEVLKLEEDLKVQVKLNVSLKYEGKTQTSTNNTIVTLYRRTAMQWDDSGKLSSFITPNEGIIEQFSHRVVSNLPLNYNFNFSEKLKRAIRITNALGAYGISYIEDPASPITKILGNSEAVDTVRFARKTLFIRSGDCDDTTALLSSLLESAGIDTAVMTSPGHVFMAFNSEEPIANRWMYETEKVSSIPYNGNLWIPVETTYLEDGFFKSWESASKTLRTNKGKIEFLPLEEERRFYPPLALGESIYQVLEPGNDLISVLDNISNLEIRKYLYQNLIDSLKIEETKAINRRKSAIQNRLGILHIRFNNMDAAEKIFLQINKEQPEYLSAYANLANLYRIQNKTENAISLLESTLKASNNSTSLNIILAQCYYEKSEFKKANDLFAKISSKTPDIASKFAYLALPKDNENSIERASRNKESQPIFWDLEE